MMKKYLFVSLFLFILFLGGCAVPNKEPDVIPTRNESLTLMKLSTKGVTDQQPAIDAKHYLSKDNNIARVRAVNFENDLLIAIEVNNFQRLRLKQIEENARNKINEKYKKFNVLIMSDAKLIDELKQLEDAIEQQTISDEQLRNKINELKKLSKEQT